MIKSSLPAIAVLLLAFACDDDDPQYPPEPFIEKHSAAFVTGSSSGMPDHLRLELNIRDGDFDLGTTEVESPYHEFWLFIDDNSGGLTTVEAVPADIGREGIVYGFEADVTGSVATFAQLRSTQENLPPYSCADYQYLTVLVKRELVNEATANVVETLTIQGEEMALVADTFYTLQNENYYNMAVDFLVEQQDGSFQYFDFFRTTCVTFHGRFSPLDELTVGTQAVTGPFSVIRTGRQKATVYYTMQSLAFRALFEGKKIKMQVSVKDRSLNNSNTIETEAVLIQ